MEATKPTPQPPAAPRPAVTPQGTAPSPGPPQGTAPRPASRPEVLPPVRPTPPLSHHTEPGPQAVAKSWIQDNQLTAVLGGFALGVFLGAWMRS